MKKIYGALEVKDKVTVRGFTLPTELGSVNDVITLRADGSAVWAEPPGAASGISEASAVAMFAPKIGVEIIAQDGTVGVSAGNDHTTYFMGASSVATINAGFEPSQRIEFIAEGDNVTIQGVSAVTINGVVASASFTLSAYNGALLVAKTSAAFVLVGV